MGRILRASERCGFTKPYCHRPLGQGGRQWSCELEYDVRIGHQIRPAIRGKCSGLPDFANGTMCFGSNNPNKAEDSRAEERKAEPHYTLSKLNDSTHLIIHNDKDIEFPYIYLKLYSELSLAVLLDTGCGSHNGKGSGPAEELKDFIETNIFSQAEHKQATQYEYFIICSHCHFDHIGGIEAFTKASGTTIVASGFDPDFNSKKNRPGNSLCENFGNPTPNYDIDVLAGNGDWLTYKGHDLGLQVLHTPGHTPDSMAIYDDAEHWLYVGDTCYDRVADMPWNERQDVPIILPLQGNWKHFVETMRTLIDFAKSKEDQLGSKDGAASKRVRLGAGHTTSNALAIDMLQEVQTFVERVAKGEVPVKAEVPGDGVAPGGSLGDATFVFWQDEGEPRFSLMAPKSFEQDFGYL